MSERIETGRLVLRRFELHHAAELAKLIGEIDVARWLTRVPHPYSVADAVEFINRPSIKSGLVFAITSDGNLIGGISLQEELGYWLGKPFWGFGYATQATRALIEHYFATYEKDVRSGHILGNQASRSVLRKHGFEDTQVDAVHSSALGRDVSVQRMILKASNWERCA
ncbi:MAG: GNAT family N-acetyltransferase [Sulfitobacter sp.]